MGTAEADQGVVLVTPCSLSRRKHVSVLLLHLFPAATLHNNCCVCSGLTQPSGGRSPSRLLIDQPSYSSICGADGQVSSPAVVHNKHQVYTLGPSKTSHFPSLSQDNHTAKLIANTHQSKSSFQNGKIKISSSLDLPRRTKSESWNGGRGCFRGRSEVRWSNLMSECSWVFISSQSDIVVSE